MRKKRRINVGEAYALETPDDNIGLYRGDARNFAHAEDKAQIVVCEVV